MIALRHVETGAIHNVTSSEGYDPIEWLEVGELPAGVPPELTAVDGAIVLADLPRIRVMMSERVKELRDLHRNGGMDTPIGRVETDAESRDNISGMVQRAGLLGEAFSAVWRTESNDLIPIDAATMNQLGLMVSEHILQCQYRKNALDEAIAEAQTLTELAAIDLEAGWPGS